MGFSAQGDSSHGGGMEKSLSRDREVELAGAGLEQSQLTEGSLSATLTSALECLGLRVGPFSRALKALESNP
jgi:hypothetical protein